MDTSATSPQLPVELIHEILRLLDKSSLVASAQVSHAWMHLSRLYLFESITYRLRPENHKKAPEGSEFLSNLLPLQELLDYIGSSPIVCGYIQHLTLTLPRQRRLKPLPLAQLWHVVLGSSPSRETDQEFCRFQTIISTLRRLPNMLTLQVDGVPFHTPGPPFDKRPVADLPVIPHLKELRIPRWWQATAGHPAHADNLLHLLCLFNEVDHLYLGPFRFLTHDSLAALINLRIHSLTFEDAQTLAPLLPLPNLWRLHTLSIPCLRPEDAPLATKLTSLTHDNLRHVALKLHRPTAAYESPVHDFSYLRALDFASFSNIQSLSVVVSVYDVPLPSQLELVGPLARAGFYQPAYTYLTSMLPSLPHTLQGLSFTLHYFSADPLYGQFREYVPSEWTPYIIDAPMQADWSELDNVLTDRVNRGLQNVEFRDLIRPCLPVVERKHIVEALPKTWRSGVVRFSQDPRP